MASSIHNPPAEAARPRPLSLEDLEQALASVEGTVVLAPSRILRRVIKQACGIRGLGLRVPHRKTFVLQRGTLRNIVAPNELKLPSIDDNDLVTLLTQPTQEALAGASAHQILSKYWRLLFHARVHQAFDERIASGRLTAAGIQQRIGRLGSVEFDEIRAVLRQEDLLLPPTSDVATYVEFAAVYLELRFFADAFLPAYFPALDGVPRIDDLLREDIDAAALFAASRPAGAPQRPWRGDLAEDRAERPRWLLGPAAPKKPWPWRFHDFSRRAAEEAGLGNRVGAAIKRMKAARYADLDEARQSRADARADLNYLAYRLGKALGFSLAEAEDWSRSLVALLELSAVGFWTPEARLLYDLQKVCVDFERQVYALDLSRWLGSLLGAAWRRLAPRRLATVAGASQPSPARVPLNRELPGQRDVLMLKHLAAARGRLRSVRISAQDRRRFESLLDGAIERTEHKLRARFRPKIAATLDEVGLAPINLPERVARAKLIEELLDRVAEHGFLSMGDLRDALSRNNLKLPDLADGHQFLFGDQLLRTDALLAERMDGVYRRGEIYLRWPQRLSSLAFGLPWGRSITRYIAIPFGGAFLLVEFLQHVTNIVRVYLLKLEERALEEWARDSLVLAIGAFVIGLMAHPGFRRAVLAALRLAGRILRQAIVEWPARLLQLPLVHAIIASRPFVWATRYALKPLLFSTLLLAATDSLSGLHPTSWGMALLFVGTNLLLNSRLGRTVDELATDLIMQGWHRFRIHVIAGLYRLIVEVFRRLLEGLERLLYTVDEWLRFRSGEGRAATAVKAVLGLAWAFVHYIIRFCVNLLVEPQLNPIKHFPVVTVSHKVISPILYPQLESLLAGPLGAWSAAFYAGIATLLVPGVFGFLAWELKENWRLYSANRRTNLAPIHVGHHGETVLQLLKPGFRSGTIPKFYAKLRRTSRKGFWSGDWRGSRQQREHLEDVELTLRRLVDRELLTLLHNSRGWRSCNLVAGEIRLGSNRIAIELGLSPETPDRLLLTLSERGGLLIASFTEHGWLDRLSPESRQTLENALAGFYKIAGVHAVLQQVESRLPMSATNYQFLEQGLLVRLTDGPDRFYPLELTENQAEDVGRGAARIMSADECRRLLFALNPISWSGWVGVWQADLSGAETPARAGQTLA